VQAGARALDVAVGGEEIEESAQTLERALASIPEEVVVGGVRRVEEEGEGEDDGVEENE